MAESGFEVDPGFLWYTVYRYTPRKGKLVGGFSHPVEKYARIKLDHSPRYGENKKMRPPPRFMEIVWNSNHHSESFKLNLLPWT